MIAVPASDTVQRVGALYLPLLLALLGYAVRRRVPFRATAVLLAVLWVLPALMLLQHLNLCFAWWSFPAGSPATLRGMPLELLLGWTVLWGVLPVTALPSGVVRRLLLLLALDVAIMPLCPALVVLHRSWWVGEAVAAALVLLPALLIADWTEHRRHVRGRAALQVLTAALVFLFGLPELLFTVRPGQGWLPLVHLHAGARQLVLECLFAIALPGISAAQEFAERGGGTPLPFDPPVRLVRSGVYRYCSNPMQLFCALALLLWSAVLHAPLFAFAALLTVAYSAGLALWDEHTDLRERFGESWLQYRRAVPAWRLRLQPYHAGPPATAYLARTCATCSAVRRWIERQPTTGLQLVDAEALADNIQRMRYDPGDGSAPVHGVRAMARVLEHIHLGYAFVGWFLRMPGVWHVTQLALDAGGLGPRKRVCSAPAVASPAAPSATQL